MHSMTPDSWSNYTDETGPHSVTDVIADDVDVQSATEGSGDDTEESLDAELGNLHTLQLVPC